jgi:hypothetical protein
MPAEARANGQHRLAFHHERLRERGGEAIAGAIVFGVDLGTEPDVERMNSSSSSRQPAASPVRSITTCA